MINFANVKENLSARLFALDLFVKAAPDFIRLSWKAVRAESLDDFIVATADESISGPLLFLNNPDMFIDGPLTQGTLNVAALDTTIGIWHIWHSNK